MILDHVGFNVSDFAASREFYLRALEPLGIGIALQGEGWAMFGKEGKGQFWIGSFGPVPGRIHVAFSAASREHVRAFHAAAMAAGAQDNGAPGLRPQYHPNYYGAFVVAPDGHNIEAVYHLPE